MWIVSWSFLQHFRVYRFRICDQLINSYNKKLFFQDYNMSFKTLPTEILLTIIKHIPTVDRSGTRKYFPTKLLLVNKFLCHLLMLEQVKCVRLASPIQASQWLAIIDITNKSTYSVPRYQDLLNNIHTLDIGWYRNNLTSQMLGFIRRCTNLSSILIQNFEGKLVDIFDAVPSDIHSIFVEMVIAQYCSLINHLKQNRALTELELRCMSEMYLSLSPCIWWDSAYPHDISHPYLDANIDDEGLYTLIESIKHNTTLTKLSLGGILGELLFVVAWWDPSDGLCVLR